MTAGYYSTIAMWPIITTEKRITTDPERIALVNKLLDAKQITFEDSLKLLTVEVIKEIYYQYSTPIPYYPQPQLPYIYYGGTGTQHTAGNNAFTLTATN